MGSGVVVILGARGMLGSDLTVACAERGFEVRAYDLPEFDITNREQVEQAVGEAGVILNCAAYTNVDGAESESALAHRINAEAVGQLGEVARERGAWILHFSTDFVFDGKLDRPYVETDEPNPINEYGKSKLAGERCLADTGCACCIVRLQWTYGTRGHNFVTKIIERAKSGAPLKVVDDQVGAPTATTEIAQVTCELAQQRVEGLFHFAGAGYASRFEVAQFILDKLGFSAELSPCRSADFVTPAERPLNSRFDCSKIQGLLDEPIRSWQETLESFLRRL
jgi:dTDP-4-dehydrorhamnose reductase